MLTRDQVAALLGVRPATWSGYVSRGQAPAPVRFVGRTPLWDRGQVLSWHESRPGRGRSTTSPPSSSRGVQQPAWLTPREVAAVHRLLDAYIVTDDTDPGLIDLVSAHRRLGQLEMDNSAYDNDG